MDKNNKLAQSSGGNGVGRAFALLAIGFTVISAWNGFDLYRILFGIAMGLLIVSVLETARLACLYRFFKYSSRTSLLSLVLYAAVASVCSFASINSFAAKVIAHEIREDREITKVVNTIRRAYASRAGEKAAALDKDVAYLENMIARFPARDYWKRRLAQVLEKRDAVLADRDALLSAQPENPEQWITAKSADLGIALGDESREKEEMRSVTLALHELWRMDKKTAQKIIGIVITITAELSIVLFSLLSTRQYHRPVTVRPARQTSKAKRAAVPSENECDSIALKRFAEVAADRYNKTGKLPPLRKLAPNLRPICKALKAMDRERLELIFREATAK